MVITRFFFDTETFLITQREPFPRMVCMQFTYGDDEYCLSQASYEADTLEDIMMSVLEGSCIVVGQNVAYDMGVVATKWPDLLPLVFAKYDRGEVTDTMVRQKLIDIVRGKRKWAMVNGTIKKSTYNLDTLVRRNCPEHSKDKEDPWRLRYGELIDTPLVDWPEEAKSYALNDAVVTEAVYNAQEEKGRSPYHDFLADEYRQTRHAWALALMSAHGIRTAPNAVQSLKKAVQERRAELKADLSPYVRPNGTRDVRAARKLMWEVCKAEGLEPAWTDTGAKKEEFTEQYVSLSAEACGRTDNATLKAYAEYGTLAYVESKDVKALEGGMYGPIHAYFDGLQETGRTSCSRPQLQNVRRLPGIRECFVPRKGKVFVQADYAGLEMSCLAQVCWTWFGESALREAINAGIDTHLLLAAKMMRIDYLDAKKRLEDKDPEVKEERRIAKAGNFGFPGGLGAATFVEYVRGYGIKISEEEAKALKADWLETWPEVVWYFERINEYIQTGEPITQLFTGRQRGDMTYCSACNTMFQGLGSDLAKDALYQVIKEQYTDQGTALYGTRSVLFIHDEIILECDDGMQHAVALALRDAMLKPKELWLPDVHIDVDFCAMDKWSKNAEAVWGDNGELGVWRG